ncbi:DNA helicase PIF1/RRM3 [Phaffia rhodozyma]|uniref:ATP-dependent DNA helicase n=1 Tax=Phaffia rhodozyma TaxID=264483 RepID=A0A0F7SF36_PHARH|nr:DNA helicase PIF1/RRM3 [Phaffia rhodozyma]
MAAHKQSLRVPVIPKTDRLPVVLNSTESLTRTTNSKECRSVDQSDKLKITDDAIDSDDEFDDLESEEIELLMSQYDQPPSSSLPSSAQTMGSSFHSTPLSSQPVERISSTYSTLISSFLELALNMEPNTVTPRQKSDAAKTSRKGTETLRRKRNERSQSNGPIDEEEPPSSIYLTNPSSSTHKDTSSLTRISSYDIQTTSSSSSLPIPSSSFEPIISSTSATYELSPSPSLSLCDLTLTDESEALQSKLSSEQRDVLRLVLDGESVFFSGPAGTGKSFLLKEIIRQLQDRGQSIAITATTGIAALPLQGQTIHSWAGIGQGQLPAEALYRAIAKLTWDKDQGTWVERNPPITSFALDRWREVDILVIDELSMLDGVLLVLLGDFFQLPPVANKGQNATFAFEASSWSECVNNVVMLKKVFRQKDENFVNVLNQMRIDRLDENSIKLLTGLSRAPEGRALTELYPTRSQVTRANTLRLGSLTGALIKYPAIDYPGCTPSGKKVEPERVRIALRACRAADTVELKVGARVMLLVNLGKDHPNLVNGSTGSVVQFLNLETARRKNIRIAEQTIRGSDGRDPLEITVPLPTVGKVPKVFPVIKFDTETLLIPSFRFEEQSSFGPSGRTYVEATRVQIPLMLGWALSIHKSQGMTLTDLKIDLDRTFEKGQAYVGISRCVSLQRLQVLNFNIDKVRAHPKVIRWARDLLPELD